MDSDSEAGVDSAWEQKKLEARKLLENATDFPPSAARGAGQSFLRDVTSLLIALPTYKVQVPHR